jgi:hypothetical protein
MKVSFTRDENWKGLVQIGIERGWVRLPAKPPMTDYQLTRCQGRKAYETYRKRHGKPLRPKVSRSREQQLERMRICMARLRAERRGQDTSRFPARIRKPPKRKTKAHGV